MVAWFVRASTIINMVVSGKWWFESRLRMYMVLAAIITNNSPNGPAVYSLDGCYKWNGSLDPLFNVFCWHFCVRYLCFSLCWQEKMLKRLKKMVCTSKWFVKQLFAGQNKQRRVWISYKGIQILCTKCFYHHHKSKCQSRRVKFKDYVLDFVKNNPAYPYTILGRWSALINVSNPTGPHYDTSSNTSTQDITKLDTLNQNLSGLSNLSTQNTTTQAQDINCSITTSATQLPAGQLAPSSNLPYPALQGLMTQHIPTPVTRTDSHLLGSHRLTFKKTYQVCPI